MTPLILYIDAEKFITGFALSRDARGLMTITQSFCYSFSHGKAKKHAGSSMVSPRLLADPEAKTLTQKCSRCTWLRSLSAQQSGKSWKINNDFRRFRSARFASFSPAFSNLAPVTQLVEDRKGFAQNSPVAALSRVQTRILTWKVQGGMAQVTFPTNQFVVPAVARGPTMKLCQKALVG